MKDLFAANSASPSGSGDEAYTAHDIEVLEGLEPVRRRPGMYVGGTDERALHHLVAELVDNAMDEAVAGHANRIELELEANDALSVSDNGRGIPIDPHPRFPEKSALEVILTTLHSGGKFGSKAYATSGGLHGVGVSVVNALSEALCVEVARAKTLYRQSFSKGRPLGAVETVGPAPNRRGTKVRFAPDRTIFDPKVRFDPKRLHDLARSKAYLFRGVEIRWSCDPSVIEGAKNPPPAKATFHFPNGLADFLGALMDGRERVTAESFSGEAALAEDGRVEWAIAWPLDEEPHGGFYCNTVPTPLGGAHEQGLRAGLLKGLKAHGERLGAQKRLASVTGDDLLGGAAALLSLFVREPQFQGQTKDKLVTPWVARLVETAVRDRFELWLGEHAEAAQLLIDHAAQRADERAARKKAREVKRQSATRKLRLPGKLADCARNAREGSEIFIVEGDSAGGSAKQARARETQAILPLRGKILNVASATADKLAANKELADLVTALGCGAGKQFRLDDLRYERVIVMTDADVDGSHIGALLMTFFFREMRGLVEAGHLYLAQPPLYRLTAGGETAYAQDEAERDRLLATVFKKKKNVDIGRFKGLGEMNPKQLKETTMDPATRKLLRIRPVKADLDHEGSGALIDRLLGKKPELRLAFIQENAAFAGELDI